MENQNIQIVRECVEVIQNGKHFERLYDFYSEKCTFYSAPYVGLGFLRDDSSGNQVVVKSVAPHSPVAGKVQAGDVVLRARDANGEWEGYDQLRTGLWGQGKLGTEVTLTLLRNGETLEATFSRGRVEGYSNTLAEIKDGWQHFLEVEMPDLHTEINVILGAGDMVAYYSTNTGTSAIYHQSGIWPECNILRLEDGRIVEWWGVEDGLALWSQLGYRITEPAK